MSQQKFSKITKDLKKGPKCWQEGTHSKNCFCLFCAQGIHEQLSKQLNFKNCKKVINKSTLVKINGKVLDQT
jgi:hypothetical protein